MPGKEVTMLPRSLLAGFGLIVFLSTAGVVTHAQQTADKVSPVPEVTQGNGGESETVGQAPTLQHRSRYQLRLSDVLALSFPFAPEFDQTATVQPDGYITLRGVGSIRVEGQTVPVVTQMLRNAYAKFMHDPVITVELREFERPYFIVGGEVGHTGKFDLRGQTTIVEAVAIAGGFRESAKHSEVQHFHRVENGWRQAESVNVKKLLREGNLEEAAYLQSGDFLYVPKSTFSKIARFIPSTSLGAYVNPYQPR